ncbi:transposase [Plesiocystis pacifica SIR-1]|uniref:Transposase n=1 Tax=Plesiocystis pacifica SIR-1 TaxID=391625 RepID=A6G2E6_9BACT|nr:IS110 family transposase [Plesiocystis pacifica]EDM79883.1 transposase [Plesiocystis pacifica SIR-1]
MEVLHPRCTGLDVHKDSVVACVRLAHDGEVTRHVETFKTTTRELQRLRDWIQSHGCSHVIMEATGVYWKPVWHVLDGHFELTLANALHVKAVPGRKTDINDATWLADLLAHGLVRASFVPESWIQHLRSLTRTRKQFVHEKTRHIQRLQKVLQDANIKLTSVLSDVMGKSGRAILEALIKGKTDPEELAGLASTRLRASRQEVIEALRGHFDPSHRFLLELHYRQVQAIEKAIEKIDAELGNAKEPFREAVELLTTIPGVSTTIAEVIVSELGTDMTRFPSVKHLLSWAGMCPRNDESAGKRRSTRVRMGAPWLKTQLVQAAWCATRAKRTYLRAQFLRLKSRRGPKKAVMAVAASILTAVYYMLREGAPYRDLGPDYFDRLDRNKLLKRLVRKLENLGYEVDLTQVATAQGTGG